MRVLVLSPGDDVAIVAEPDPGGIPAGHKVARQALAAGAPVRRYGQVIGVATAPIRAGEHVHTHNLALDETLTRAAEVGIDAGRVLEIPAGLRNTFLGYARPDGRVGTRNYVTVVPSVNCGASTTAFVADHFRAAGVLPDGVDGVLGVSHKDGCAHGVDTYGHVLLQRVLSGFANHPNVGASVVVSLGCETNQPSLLLRGLDGRLVDIGTKPNLVVTIQEEGGVARTVKKVVDAVTELLPDLARARREEFPVGELVLGLQCGGSDGYSGITANPALGVASDFVVAQGGTSILGETPEIYGAEHLLVRRAVKPEVGEKLLERIAWWREYTAANGVTLDANPAPGNKAGGITTIWEKSLGAVAKLGTADLAAVVEYAERVPKGAVVMDTPGYDPVSVTGMVAGGATIIAFTTGRGSAFGFKPSPSIKIATNTPLAERMADDMDVNAGTIVDGTESVADVGRRVYDLLLDVASGTPSKSEAQGIGDHEFNPWHIGAVL